MLISQIYHTNPATINQSASMKEAVDFLVHHKYNALIVTGENGEVTGVLSLQDIAGAVVPNEFENNVNMANAMYKHGFFDEMCQMIVNKKVEDIMRKDFISVTLEDNILAITADFLKNDLYIVPVIEDGKLIGIVTRSEIKTALAMGMGLINSPDVEQE
jgi:predicted transcriptional regulator